MKLLLQKPVPIPLKEGLQKKPSEIWLQHMELNKGTQIFIQAPSGTGKTTLVHLLYGLRNDYEGSFSWGEKEPGSLSPSQLSHLRATYISIVFQDMRLFPQLTAWENLEIKRVVTNTVTEETVDHMMQRLDILHKKDALAQTLSYGEQQRVAIIRALLQPFDWLLLDEPFSHLDNANISKAVDLIGETIEKNGAGLIFADLELNSYFNYHKKFRL